MNAANIRIMVIVAVCLSASSSWPQISQPDPANQNALRERARMNVQAQLSFSRPNISRPNISRPNISRPKITAKPAESFRSSGLTTDNARAWMQVVGHPISKSLNERFGPPSQAALDRAAARWSRVVADQKQPSATEPAQPATCGKIGSRFNLEPRKNAVFQNGPTADFILNGAGPGADLILQTANDWRGAFPSTTWDNSMSGYYVHTSSTADCSVQFEGGLPNFANTGGVGLSVVAADNTRGVFFATDARFPGGYALFRASAADFLNPKICPPGTHNTAQSVSCWTQTQPLLFDSTSPDFDGDLALAVDERASGTGAGDVYVVADLLGDTTIVACTNSLNACALPVTIASYTGSNANRYPYVQVRSDGVITIAYTGDYGTLPSSVPILFLTCTPAGAPNPPTCGSPVTVATASMTATTTSFPMANINILLGAPLYPKIANRLETNGQFTTFMVYDECVEFYNPPLPDTSTVCINTEVNYAFSQDGGQTWSTPVSLTPKTAEHILPAITNDVSTGTVSISYYGTDGDLFFRDFRVYLSQIPPGSTTPGTPKPVSAATPIDDDPDDLAFLGAFDFRMGAIARGTGTTGQSHLFLSFDSETVDGNYDGKTLPELNNFLELMTY
jgi:hypothetical protein